MSSYGFDMQRQDDVGKVERTWRVSGDTTSRCQYEDGRQLEVERCF